MSIKIDTKDLQKGIARVGEAMKNAALKGINDVASEILRLGMYEVPHDKGLLQASGHVEPAKDDEVVVGYNKVYAARLHENPQFHFQKGRKGRYLVDPIQNNLSTFLKYMANAIKL
ncbi:MAG: hypothetical protein JW735_09190 [Prolixibacteraceae bacterium]|nr:hypothetical protein [Prolixibacteraceae bacterium]